MAEKIEYNGEMLSIVAIANMENIPKTSLDRHYKKTGDIYEAVKNCKENLVKKIEYNGEQLALKTIAKREGIIRDSLAREYEKTGDIYKAVQICKENKNKRQEKIQHIEYNGEILTIKDIAEKEKISDTSLRNTYKEKQDIYEAVRICKERQQKKRESTQYVEYEGEQLSITAIAKREKIQADSLRKAYMQTKEDIYEAIKICKEKQQKDKKKTVYIEYNGENLSIFAISKREGLSYSTLMKEFQELQDIYEAVENLKNQKNQPKKHDTLIVEYNGQKTRIGTIAREQDISPIVLKRTFEKIGNIYEAIETCKKNKMAPREYIEYNGEELTIGTIAKKEGLTTDSLKQRLKETGNIYEAVKISKRSQLIKKRKY